MAHENAFDPQTPPSDQAKTNLTGTISLEPVGGVTPSLAGIQVSLAGESFSATTDAAGRYTIRDVPAGSYAVQAVATDYETGTLPGITTTLDMGGRIIPLPALALRRVRANLAGTVDLKLPDNSLESTGGASVAVDAPAPPPAGGLAGLRLASRALSSSAGSALTDGAGAFVIPNVPAPLGSYTMTASKVGYVTQTSTITFVDGAFVVQTVQLVIDPGAVVGSVLVVGASDSFGVTVRARGATLGGTPWEQTTTTDAAGDFRISGLPAGNYNVSFELANHATVATSAAVTPGADTTLPPAELVRDTGSAFGVARLQGAADSSGIQVTLTSNPPPLDGSAAGAAVTDVSGNWRVDGLPVGDYTIVFERQPGYANGTATVTVASRRAVAAFPADVPLAVIPAQVSGKVLLEGLAAPNLFGTSVLVEGTSTPATTLADGSYVISPAPTGPQVIRFYRTGYETQKAQVTLSPGVSTALFDVALSRSRGALAGAFTLAGAASSAGIVVTATNGGTSTSTVTDATGGFSLGGLAVGSWTVSARRDPDWAPLTGIAATVDPNLTTTLTTAALNPIATASISGVALLEGAANHSGTTATLTGTDFRGVAVPGGTTATTDASGNWTFGALAAGSYQVSFAKAGYETPAPVSSSVVTAQAANAGSVTLALSRGTIAGTYTLTGAASSAGVVVTAVSGASTASTVTNSAGAFTLPNLAVGSWTVSARLDPDWSPITGVAATVTRNATTTVTTAALGPIASASISGVALLEGAANHSGTTATLTGTDFRGVAVPGGTTATTDASGNWTFGTLKAGSYQVGFAKAGYETPAPVSASVVTAQAASAGTVTLSLSRGTIAGTYTLTGAASSAGVVVTATSGAATASTVTNSAGAFTLPNLAVGSWTVSARLDPDWSPITGVAATVPRNATTTVTTAALGPIATASITGKALLEGAANHSGTTATLTGTDFRGVAVAGGTTATTDASGNWTFGSLAAGSYQVSFARAGYESPAPVSASVVTAQAANAGSVTLPLSRGTIAGTYALTGASSSAGIVVTAVSGASTASTVTNSAGAFTLPNLAVGAWTVSARLDPDWSPITGVAATVTRNATTTVTTAALGPIASASISGVALLEGAANHSGTTATLTGTDFRGVAVPGGTTAATDASGNWTFGTLNAGSYQVSFAKAGYESPAPVSASVVTAQAANAGTVTLSLSRGTIAGTYTLSGASSSAGVVVTATSGAATASTVTNSAGAFTLPNLAVGSWTVSARLDPDWSPITGVAATVTRNATTTVTTAALSPIATASITGKALLEGAANHSGTTATLTGTDFRGVAVPGGTTATTDVNGNWTFGTLAAGSYQVSFARAGYESPAPVSASVVTAQAANAGSVTLPLSRGTIAGTYTLTGALSSAGIVVTATSGASTASTVTNSAGAFTLPGLAIGAWTVSARLDPDWAPITGVAVTVTRNATSTVTTVALGPIATASISGVALLEGGADPRTVTVSLTGTDFRGAAVSAATSPTTVGGAFTFPGLVGGSYQVAYTLAGYETPAASGVSVQTGSSVAVGTTTLALSRGALGGTYTLAGAASSAGIVVTATSGAATASTVTNAAGAYTLSGLAVGSWTVSARLDPDWSPITGVAATVSRNATTTVASSALSPVATASISGVVLLEGGADPRTIAVSLNGTDFRGQGVSLAGNPTTLGGAWSFSGLVAGSYQLAFTQAGFDVPAPIGVSVSTGQAAPLGSLTLSASRGDATGIVDALGTAADAGTVVTVSGGPDTASAVTDSTGRWRVNGLRVGAGYTASYVRTGYATATSGTFSVTSGGLANLGTASLSVATTGTISGVAHVQRPAAGDLGITVTFSGTDLNGAALTGATSTNATGNWSITTLPQGTYKFTFTKASYDAQVVSGVALVAGGTVTAATVTLPVSLGIVAGQATLSKGSASTFAQGTDYSGIVVTLGNLDAGVTLPVAVTDASGNYRFDNVPVSTAGAAYTVTAQATNYSSAAGSVTALANATATVSPSPLTLNVNVGSVLTTVAVNDTGTPTTPVNGTVTVSLTGSAFNATSFSASVGNTGAGATLSNLPAGTYDVVATAANRACGSPASITVNPGAATTIAGTFTCTDSVAPGAVTLGTPQGAGAQAGYTASTFVDVPIAVHASDASGNVRGYQYVAGPVANWTGAPVTAGLVSPVSFPANTLTSDGTWTLWVRAVDQVGNAGPASSVQVVRDTVRPADVSLTTAQLYVSDTTTTATISGGADPNFRSFQSCVAQVAATATCPAPCAMADNGSVLTVSFAAANTKACLYAQSTDKAGNASLNTSKIEIVSDMIPPTSPTIAPLYDPTIVTVHAEYVDFFVTAGATDAPVGGATAWKNVARLEVDTGGGFQPMCPSSTCRDASNVWNPCSCACADTRLVCDGTTFKAIRVPLLDGTSNSVAVRAVDLAGNVGSGASQAVPTSTSLLPVSVTAAVEANQSGRGRLLTYRNDSWIALRDLGSDGRPDVGDTACNLGSIGAWGGVVSRAAVLGPKIVVHADGDLNLWARRPGADGLFCSPVAAIDDTAFAFYAIPGTVYVRNVTGSYNYTRSGEYAAWLERDRTTGVDLVKVQAPLASGLLAAGLPAPVTLFNAGVSTVSDLYEGGDCLLSSLSASFRVDCKAGGLGNATGVTTWTLPATAADAALSSDGTRLAWIEYDGATGQPRLHVRSAGPDRLYGTVDDTDQTRLGPAPYASPMAMAFDGNHVVVAEAAIQGTYWLLHWNAGPDGAFDGSAGADDSVRRVLPASVPRLSATFLTGALFVYSVSDSGFQTWDLLGNDLSTYRWEVVDSNGLTAPVSNGAGTVFFQRGSTFVARLPNGTEQVAGFTPDMYAASGNYLLTSVGTTVSLRKFTAGSWFGTPTTVYTGSVYDIKVGGKWGAIFVNEAGYRIRVSDLSVASPTTTLLPIIAGTTGPNGNLSAGSNVIGYQCNAGGNWRPCIHQPGVNGVYGDIDDVQVVLNHPGTSTPYFGYGMAAWGDRVAFNDGSNLIVVWAGPNGTFNDADDVEYNLGTISSQAVAIGGDYASWLRNTTSGVQIMFADYKSGITRQLTQHISTKESPVVDPSGRLLWLDYGFSAPAFFMYAP